MDEGLLRKLDKASAADAAGKYAPKRKEQKEAEDAALFGDLFGSGAGFAKALKETGEHRSLQFRLRAVEQLEALNSAKGRSVRGGWPRWQMDAVKEFIDTGAAEVEINGTLATLDIARKQMYNIGKAVRNAYAAPAGVDAVGELYDILLRLEISAEWPRIILRKKPLAVSLDAVVIKGESK